MHIRVKVPISHAPRYRGRKDYPTLNVLAACTFDLKFTYVMPGWERTASDSRIVKNTLRRSDNLKFPQGNFLRKKYVSLVISIEYNMHVIARGKILSW